MSKPENSTYFIARIKSFTYALKGIKTFFLTQPHSIIHSVSAIIAIAIGLYFNITKIEWLFIIGAISMVFITEVVNTSIEFLTDIVSPEFNEKAGSVKDLAAAAVLLSAVFAFIVGLIIFLPKIIALFHINEL